MESRPGLQQGIFSCIYQHNKPPSTFIFCYLLMYQNAGAGVKPRPSACSTNPLPLCYIVTSLSFYYLLLKFENYFSFPIQEHVGGGYREKIVYVYKV